MAAFHQRKAVDAPFLDRVHATGFGGERTKGGIQFSRVALKLVPVARRSNVEAIAYGQDCSIAVLVLVEAAEYQLDFVAEIDRVLQLHREFAIVDIDRGEVASETRRGTVEVDLEFGFALLVGEIGIADAQRGFPG